jgi:hypothetical protein
VLPVSATAIISFDSNLVDDGNDNNSFVIDRIPVISVLAGIFYALKNPQYFEIKNI